MKNLRWTQLQSVSWRIFAELLHRHPNDGLRVVETYPCGGFYHCLGIWDRTMEAPLFDISLASGSLRKHTERGEPLERMAIAENAVIAYLEAHERRNIIEEIERAVGLPNAISPEDVAPSIACLRTMAAWLALLSLDDDDFEARSALSEEDGNYIHAPWVDRVPNLSAKLDLNSPKLVKRGMRYWRVAQRGAPGDQGVVFDLREGLAFGPQGDLERVADLYDATGSVEVVIGHLAAMVV